MMRILLPFRYAALGGSQLSALRLIDALPQRYCFRAWLWEDGPLAEELERRRIPYRLLPRGQCQWPWGLFFLVHLLQKERPDLIYLHTTRLLALLAHFLSIPCVERINMSRVAEAGGFCAHAGLDRFFSQCNTQLLIVSQAIGEQLTQRGISPHKMVLIRNGVDAQRFYRPELRWPTRQRLGLPAEAPLVVNIGRFVPQKGQLDFLRVAARCLQRRPEIHFLLVGEGPLAQQLQEEIARLGLSTRVRLLPFAQQIEEILAAADLLLHTAQWEPLANVLLEAMAAGLPVVATDVDGTAEVVIQEETGLLTPSGDVPALAEGVLRLLADEPLRQRWGMAGRQRVMQHFSKAMMVQQFEQLFDHLAGRGRSSGSGHIGFWRS